MARAHLSLFSRFPGLACGSILVYCTVQLFQTARLCGNMSNSKEDPKTYSVLFVCLGTPGIRHFPDRLRTLTMIPRIGNICRSPMAEAVFKEVVKRRGLQAHFPRIESAGTAG